MADFKSQPVHEIHGYKYDSCEDILGQVGVRSFVFPPGGPGGGYYHILAIRVCAAGKGMIFKSFSLV